MWSKAVGAAEKKFQDEQMKQGVELESLRKRDEEARKRETEFFREKLAMEQKQKDMELDKERAIMEARKSMEADLSKQSQERFKLESDKMQLEYDKKMQEKEKQMDQMRRAVEDANRKATQGSMQIQGDTQENAIRDLLVAAFPWDTIADVPTGVKGADIIQTVRNSLGHEVGIIVWESKNTKAWSDSWIDKLKEDRLRVNASVSIIVSSVLPDGVKHFGLHRDIWITEWNYVHPLTLAIRDQMIETHKIKNSLEGKDEKMELIYTYLTSTEFRDKIQNIIEAFQTMKDSLDQEKRAMEKIWSSREKQLDRVISNTARLYGDMQGLIGSKLQTVDYLELGSGEE